MPEIPQFFSDLAPRSREVLVGDHVLVVREMVHRHWERFAKLLAEAANWVAVLSPLKGLVTPGETVKVGDVMAAVLGNLDGVVGAATSLVKETLGKNVPELALLALDFPVNDAAVGGAKGAAVEFARDNMTVRQTLAVLEAAVEVNDVGDVLGKFQRLVRAAVAAAKRGSVGTAAPTLVANPPH